MSWWSDAGRWWSGWSGAASSSADSWGRAEQRARGRPHQRAYHPPTGPESEDARPHVFTLPFPYRVVDMPEGFMEEWKARAESVSLKLSIRAMRNTWHREGLAEQSNCSNVLSLVAPQASGTQLRETALNIATHLVRALHDAGLHEPIDVDEGKATTDDIDEDDFDEKEITMYGVTTYVRKGHMCSLRVPLPIAGRSTPGGVVVRNLHSVQFRPQPRAREAQAATRPASRSRSPSVKAPPAAKRAPRPAGGVPPATGGVSPAAGGVSPAAGGVSSAVVPFVAVPTHAVSLSSEEVSPAMLTDVDESPVLVVSRNNLERQAQEACKLAEAVMPFLQKGDMNFATHIKEVAATMLLQEASFVPVKSSVEVAFCITTYRRTQQLVTAIPLNVVECWPFRDRVALVLVDFNEAEEDRAEIQARLHERCPAALETGLVRYFELAPHTTHWQGWHASVAKNTSHMAAIGLYGRDVCLVNVDGDNLLTRQFLEHILEHAPAMRWIGGGVPSAAGSSAGGVSPAVGPEPRPALAGITYKNPKASSTTGRVALGGATFVALGGYREDFLPMGYQDVDLSGRIGRFGKHIRVESDTIGNAILNVMATIPKRDRMRAERSAKIANVDKSRFAMDWDTMQAKNFQMAKRDKVLVANPNSTLGLRAVQKVLWPPPRAACPPPPQARPPPPVPPPRPPPPRPPPPQHKPKFVVYTFGVQKLAMAFPRSILACRMRDMVRAKARNSELQEIAFGA